MVQPLVLPVGQVAVAVALVAIALPQELRVEIVLQNLSVCYQKVLLIPLQWAQVVAAVLQVQIQLQLVLIQSLEPLLALAVAVVVLMACRVLAVVRVALVAVQEVLLAAVVQPAQQDKALPVVRLEVLQTMVRAVAAALALQVPMEQARLEAMAETVLLLQSQALL